MRVFDEYALEYDRWYDQYPNIFAAELEAIKKFLPVGEGLEVGVGTGRFAQALGIKRGIDLSLNMAKISSRRGVEVGIAKAEGLPFAANSFSFVLFVTVFCFLSLPDQALKEACRVLKAKGRIILGIIDGQSYLGRRYQEKKSKFYQAARFFSPPQLVKMLEAERFRFVGAYQTLFAEKENSEKIKPGWGEGGFVVICGEK